MFALIKNMLLLCLICVLGLMFPKAVVAEKLLVISGSEYRPYYYNESGAPKGIVYDLVRSVIESMGLQIQAKSMPYKRTYAELASGQADMNIIIYSEHSSSADYPPEFHVGSESLFELKVVGASLSK